MDQQPAICTLEFNQDFGTAFKFRQLSNKVILLLTELEDEGDVFMRDEGIYDSVGEYRIFCMN